ncbi:acyl-CoA dehydrogenase family protein [uncultured Thiothrix sp.]|uniref:acyl-CoA dehydrogenase family protein n=1 Tax=uncultured Thiothrix sp. TaxID=223185 RepID=UPI0026047AE6|nr:acyl-CoA dehydrogenase family protein [uncultured Thiothrix sp.]
MSVAIPNPIQQALDSIITDFAKTAVARDKSGGTPKIERDLLRQSGLLNISTPIELGGAGLNWQQTLDTVRQLAQVDSSLAHVFAFHHLLLATTRLFGAPDQWQRWYRDSAKYRCFWGNALNPLDQRTTSEARPGGRIFNGEKSFCSGATDSQMLLASAIQKDAQGQNQLVIAVLPSDRAGIHIYQDWNNMGQRQTDSGSVRFEYVVVDEYEVLTHPGPLSSPFACLRPLLAQLILTQIYLGIAEGALQEAKHYTHTQTRRWSTSLAATALDDPYIVSRYGEFYLGLESARLLNERATYLFDQAWQQELDLSEQQRGEVALAVTLAKLAAGRISLEVSSRLFEVCGARATTATLGLDRYWRNVRVHSLHDPFDYKIKELGDWQLNNRYPTPSFYS